MLESINLFPWYIFKVKCIFTSILPWDNSILSNVTILSNAPLTLISSMCGDKLDFFNDTGKQILSILYILSIL